MTKELRSFEPICFQANPIVLTKEDIIQIDKIKEDFNFLIDYDLHSHLSQLSIDIASLDEIERQTPTPKEMHTYLETIKKKISKIQIHAEDINNSLSKINEIQTLLDNTGTRITSFIANKNPNYYKELNALRDAVDFFDFNNIPGLYIKLETIKSLSRTIPCIIEEAEKNLPAIKRGAPNKPFIKGIIQLLMKIYTEGTRREATCGYVSDLGEYTIDGDILGKYVGNFYDFLVTIEPYITSKLNITLGTPNTLGKYTCEVLSELKNQP